MMGQVCSSQRPDGLRLGNNRVSYRCQGVGLCNRELQIKRAEKATTVVHEHRCAVIWSELWRTKAKGLSGAAVKKRSQEA